MGRQRPSKRQRQSISIASRPEEFEKIESALMRYLSGYPHDENFLFSVRLAVEEAVTNAIKHGNAEDPSKRVSVRFGVNDTKVVIVVEDEGEGFNLEDIPDCTEEGRIELPHGRGILLMRSFMDSVTYNDKGNIVTLEKELPCNPEPLC